MNRINHIDWQNLSDRAVLGILVSIALASLVFSWMLEQAGSAWWNGAWQNFSTEIMGAFVTFLLLEKIVGARQRREDQAREDERREIEAQREAERREIEAHRAREKELLDLIAKMASRNNETALEAVKQLRQRGWLADGSLENADLRRANLDSVNLQYCTLSNANLSGASLQSANLRQANLSKADLDNADLRGANLSEANLSDANLSGSYLLGTVLHEYYFGEAQLSEETWLPNGESWTPDTDMRQYTDADHPAFWQPRWVTAGYDSHISWRQAGMPRPWQAVGYADDHMAWVRAGKPDADTTS